ncbi:low molecular weight protein-tyrosine-phosphatase [Halomonas sp. C05BenzN]|uniref:low molecular weight protein-tyrosine-phosphatase n=1 Tax=Halomonas sp. C05BenzN TaxID=3411041 RepID=UPI003B923322
MFQRILVVCIGNVCRSPVGAALLRQGLPGCHVTSAGLGALVGEGVEPVARRLAEADGLDVAGHRARQLDGGLVRDADLVLVMSEGQRLAIAERFPSATGKTMGFGRWLPDEGGKGGDIPDPYRRSEEVFVHVHERLTDAARGWLARLGAGRR